MEDTLSSLEGRVALVTGGARRLGAAIVRRLAAAGCRVAIHYRSSEGEAGALCESLVTDGVDAALFQADLAERTDGERLIAQVAERFDGLDILVNNASLFERIPFEEIDDAGWDRMLEVNLSAPARLVRLALPQLRQRSGACVVNLCDIGGALPWKGYAHYCVSKAGLIMLTRALAIELAPHIRVNGVSPGTAEFPPDFTADQRERILRRIPMQRSGTADEIARTVHMLIAGPEFITGQIVNMDGGRSARW